MPLNLNLVNQLKRYLPPYLNPDDSVVETVLGAFAAQWEQVATTWEEALQVFSILGATGSALTAIGHFFSVDRFPDETDDHLLARIAAVLSRRPTQNGFQYNINLLSQNGTVNLYTPTGAYLTEYNPSLSYRWDRQTITGTFTRKTSAWDPYTRQVVGENTPTFTAVRGVPPANTDTQAALQVWQSASNFWPYASWTNTVLSPTFTPNTANSAYWTVLEGTAPAFNATSISSVSSTWVVTGPTYTEPLSWTGTLDTTGMSALLWAWGSSGGYFAGVSGTTVLLGKGTTSTWTVLDSGSLPAATTITGTVHWGAGGSLLFQWTQGTTTGTLSGTDTTYTSGQVGWGNWAGSGTFSPQAVQTPFPSNIQVDLPAGVSAQVVDQTVCDLPAPGNAIQLQFPLPDSATLTGPAFTLNQSGTWSWWGQTTTTTGTLIAQAGNYSTTWSAYPWGDFSLSIPSGTYMPQWVCSGTNGSVWIGMPQWEVTPYPTPYIFNESPSTLRSNESAQVVGLACPQNQGMVGLGVYITDAFNAVGTTLWELNSGTAIITTGTTALAWQLASENTFPSTVNCQWQNDQWVTTWTTSGTSFSTTWDLPLAPNQWHYGLWTWGPLGWSWSWDGVTQTGADIVPWAAGEYTLAFGQDAQYTNVTVSDGVLPPAETTQWSSTFLTPIFSQTVWQGNFTNNIFAGDQGQMGNGWPNMIGIQFPYSTTQASDVFILNSSALNESPLGGQLQKVNASLVQSIINPSLPAGIVPFGWQRGILT